MNKKVIIIGGGFGGVSAALKLSNRKNLDVILIDRRNHHLFQPLLYQVAMAGLNPSDIATPLRRLFSRSKNVKTLMAEIETIDLQAKKILMNKASLSYDYLILATGSKHFYFGNNEWESIAPGLKTIEQATEIRRRVLLALERAENETDPTKQQKLLTFAIVGGGPTGVELAGAIAEMTRSTLYKDYKNANLKNTKVFLIESGPRVLSAFPEKLSLRAKKDLEQLGVQVVLNKMASKLSYDGLSVGGEWLDAKTIIWAAGVKPSKISESLQVEKIKDGRVLVNQDLSLRAHLNVFAIGDLAAFDESLDGKPKYLPSLAPVAMQQGRFVARAILNDLKAKSRGKFKYNDKGIMATIGRARAVVSSGPIQISGFVAWVMWAFVHIAFLIQFRNKMFVLMQWTWSYFRFGSGSRLIIHKTWKFYSGEKIPISGQSSQQKTDTT